MNAAASNPGRVLVTGGGSGLGAAVAEGEWRQRVCEGMNKAVDGSPDDWRFIITSFEADLRRLQYRNRYITALAGAVFFLCSPWSNFVQGQVLTVNGGQTTGMTA